MKYLLLSLLLVLGTTAQAQLRTLGAATATSLWNWPVVDGTIGQVLETDGAGNLTWATASGGAVNLTGPITSVGAATSIASQTGTGTTFVMDTSPTLVTPNLGTPSAAVLTNASGTAASLTAGHVTTNANLTGDATSVGNASTVVGIQGTSVSSTVPTIGQRMVYNGTNWIPANSANELRIKEDFVTGDYQGTGYIVSENSWRSVQTGGPTFTCRGATIPSTNAHPGVLQITVSAAGTDVGSIATGSYNNNANASIAPGGGTVQIDVVFDIPTLSDGTNNTEFDFGLIDAQLGSAPTNAIYIQYQREGSLNWRFITEASGSATTTASSVAVTSGWHHGTIIINAAGTSVSFYMDGGLLGTTTTHIPTAAIQFEAGYRKTLGAGAMVVGIDYIEIYEALTTAR